MSLQNSFEVSARVSIPDWSKPWPLQPMFLDWLRPQKSSWSCWPCFCFWGWRVWGRSFCRLASDWPQSKRVPRSQERKKWWNQNLDFSVKIDRNFHFMGLKIRMRPDNYLKEWVLHKLPPNKICVSEKIAKAPLKTVCIQVFMWSLTLFYFFLLMSIYYGQC